MKYYYITSEGCLLRIADFHILPGATPVTRMRSLDGREYYIRGRKQPDTFIMLAPRGADSLGEFRVVDSNALVYGCLGHNIAIKDGQISVAGTIYDRWEPDQKEEAMEAINALGKQE